MRELMPRTDLPAARHRRPGRSRRGPRARLRPAPRRRARDRVALDRGRARAAPGADAGRRRARRGRAAARRRLGACLGSDGRGRPRATSVAAAIRPPYAPGVLMRRRRSPARWLAPIALVACAVAVYSVVNATLLRRADGDVDGLGLDDLDREQHRTSNGTKSSKRAARRRRAYTVKAGRHAVVDLRRRPASRSRASRSSTRSSTPSRFRPASGSSSRRDVAPRRAVRRPRAGASSPSPSPRRRSSRPRRRAAAAADGPVVRAPAAILVEPATGDVVFRRNADDERPVASTTKLMTALLTLEREKLSTTFTTIRYRAAPGRVRDRPARRRAHDGRRPHARPAAGERERRRRDAGRPRRRHARALRAR